MESCCHRSYGAATKLYPKAQALSTALHELEAYLRIHDEPYWGSQVARCVAWIDESDHYGVQRFLELFGGVGSLNDLVLHRDGASLIAENDHLQTLIGRAYALSDSLRHAGV